MRVANGAVFTGGRFIEADLLIEGGRVKEVRPATDAACEQAEGAGDAGCGDGAVLDASGCYVVPGFVDVHFHGCMGADLCDGSVSSIREIARYEASRGVTAICPATMTYPEERLATIGAAASSFEPAADEAALVGVNMEGPFISPDKIGAQNPAYVQTPDLAMLRRVQQAFGGLVKLVDVAPEEPGALDFIGAAAGEFRMSLAHTCADYDCAREAFARGARQMTHLYNAMPGLHHRNPGPIAAAWECPDAAVELICDGVHIHPAMVRLTFGLFGDDRVILVSDSMRATGLDDGQYDLGGQEVTVRGNRATLADGTIAGSVTDLAACLRHAVKEMGVPLESAVKAATINPARAIGVAGERGSLDPGKVADAVVLDADLQVRHVILRGEEL